MFANMVGRKRLRQRQRGRLAVALVVFVGAGVALAGEKRRERVSIVFSGNAGLARGSLGSARNSDRPREFIRCGTYHTRDGTNVTDHMECEANDGQRRGACTSSLPFFIDQVRGVDSMSKITFTWDEQGQCTSVSLEQSSMFEPPDEPTSPFTCAVAAGGPR